MSESAPLDRLIVALAERAVAEHLTPKPAPEQESGNERTNRGDLPATDKAA